MDIELIFIRYNYFKMTPEAYLQQKKKYII